MHPSSERLLWKLMAMMQRPTVRHYLEKESKWKGFTKPLPLECRESQGKKREKEQKSQKYGRYQENMTALSQPSKVHMRAQKLKQQAQDKHGYAPDPLHIFYSC